MRGAWKDNSMADAGMPVSAVRRKLKEKRNKYCFDMDGVESA